MRRMETKEGRGLLELCCSCLLLADGICIIDVLFCCVQLDGGAKLSSSLLMVEEE